MWKGEWKALMFVFVLPVAVVLLVAVVVLLMPMLSHRAQQRGSAAVDAGRGSR